MKINLDNNLSRNLNWSSILIIIYRRNLNWTRNLSEIRPVLLSVCDCASDTRECALWYTWVCPLIHVSVPSDTLKCALWYTWVCYLIHVCPLIHVIVPSDTRDCALWCTWLCLLIHASVHSDARKCTSDSQYNCNAMVLINCGMQMLGTTLTC